MQTAVPTGHAPARIPWASKPKAELKPRAVGPPAVLGRATRALSPLLVQIHGQVYSCLVGGAPTWSRNASSKANA